MNTFANSVDPDEMQHNAAFHQCLHSLLRSKSFSDKRIHFFFKLQSDITRYIQWTFPSFLYQKKKEESISLKG